MAFFRSAALIAAAALFSGCSNQETLNETGTMLVTLPHGEKIKAEVVTHPTEMMRGMMFRDSLPMDRGMLFIHGSPGKYTYWMYQVKIPLDIIWIGRNRQVVEISRNTPPCTSQSAKECPSYGGNQPAVFVLELAGGAAAKYGIDVGQTITF
jgi:uncharacterized membrane protein (UPF0127 family)